MLSTNSTSAAPHFMILNLTTLWVPHFHCLRAEIKVKWFFVNFFQYKFLHHQIQIQDSDFL